MLEDPEKFVNFLKNRTASWTPLEGIASPEGHKFCILAFGSYGFIPADAKCTGAIVVRSENNSDAHEKEDKVEDPCPRGFVYCAQLGQCAPREVCSLQRLSSLVGMNASCPEGTKFCLSAQERCIPVLETCHGMNLVQLPGMCSHAYSVSSRQNEDTLWRQHCVLRCRPSVARRRNTVARCVDTRNVCDGFLKHYLVSRTQTS